MRSLRLCAVVLLATALSAVAGVYVGQRSSAPERARPAAAGRMMNELMSGTVAIGGPFTLLDTQGKTRSLEEFRGKLVLLYFGFTNCPDVCPTDLLAIGEALNNIGAGANQVQPLFVTLDPIRDTPETLHSYAAHFHPTFIALTGTEAQVHDVASSYRVFFEKVRALGTSTYFIDHMALTFFLDRQGRYVAALPSGTPPERLAVFMREMLNF